MRRSRFKQKTFGALLSLSLTLCLCGCGSREMEQGRLQLEHGQYEAAVASYTAVIERNARRADAYEGRGDAYAALADASKAYSAEQTAYRRNALADYKKACELDNGALKRRTLIDYYLYLGDEALAAARDDSAPTHAYSYEIANSYYQSALELDRANGDAYAKIVTLLLAQGKTDEAQAVLETGQTVTNDRVLTVLSEQIAEQEEQARRTDALRILSGMPYYGAPERCRMSAAQALSCAKLLADGLNGKFYGFSGYGKPLYDKPVFWDEPYSVIGYGSYETDRGKAVLADLAGNGVPYLCLFSTLVENNSFQVYGWDDGEMKLVVGEESWGGQQSGVLSELADGTVALVETVTTANNTRSGQTFRFRDGGAVVTESWYEARENGEAVVRVTRDGSQITYGREQWNPAASAGVSSEERELPYTSFSDILSGACPLRDMMSYLNAWAETVSDGIAESIPLPGARSERHRMGTAMLHRLFALDRLSIDSNTHVCYVRLVDLNGDGMDELLVAFTGGYASESGAECQFVIYEWKDGALAEHPGGSNFNELRLTRVKGGTARGVLGIETRGALTRYAYLFLDGGEELQVDSAEKKYYVVKHGQPAGIAESEYAVLQGQYDALERLVDFSQLSEDRNYERVVTSLYNMRD